MRAPALLAAREGGEGRGGGKEGEGEVVHKELLEEGRRIRMKGVPKMQLNCRLAAAAAVSPDRTRALHSLAIPTSHSHTYHFLSLI